MLSESLQFKYFWISRNSLLRVAEASGGQTNTLFQNFSFISVAAFESLTQTCFISLCTWKHQFLETNQK